ncbi:hypothetical protein BD324DRAFT_611935 [Kockovaella imperatae]|uniref:Uncharacterized protein n=1 Tax=Kockovaella imperatae TaxID=4999 RepID=A0A1Y1USY8_9TREE|nr:hypothetical protein BD324DRAFT_611935 [Kockovaella imperatae]ORX40747.1 hypothetical protein BD324DRAFT_611935 [Kockovaella imperatae]
MSSMVAQAGSPLGDYFKDEGDEVQATQVDSDEGDVTLVSSRSSNDPSDAPILPKGWTGVIDAVAGPSRQTLPGQYDVPDEDAFAERFKYLICTSGVLEKDYVPGLGAPTSTLEEVEPERRDVLYKMKGERWDMVLAGAVLLLALAWISPLAGASLLGIAASWVLLVRESNDTRQPAYNSLRTFLTLSHDLDTVIESALGKLKPIEPTSHEQLRIALNQTTIRMIDHLAAATSQLQSFVDGDQLKVLAEMYSVPIPKSRSFSDETPLKSISMSLSYSSPGRLGKHMRKLSLAAAPMDRFTNIPPRTPRESKRISLDPSVLERIQSADSLTPQALPVTPLSGNPKRRSLQNIPYYTDESPTKKSRGPVSELQELRSRSSGVSVPRPRHTRQMSNSPLALSALKGSCLNTHLKRRRLACCLLGLRFAERHSSYWTEICEVVDQLCTAITSEVTKLRDVLKSTKREPQTGFAPRQRPEDTLLGQVESMRSHLVVLWDQVEDVAAQVVSENDLEDRWTAIRQTLRAINRDWERGKESATGLSSTAKEPERRPESQEQEDRIEPLPAFMRRWSDATSYSVDQGETSQPVEEVLPPPGVDEVFEADIGRGRVERTMRYSEAVPMRNGEVVEELKGMIGLIRQRKGMPESRTSELAPPPQVPTVLFPSEEMRRAFVFPTRDRDA